MTGELLLGVDGGNTKTVAILAGRDGVVLGRGTSGCSDIYGASSATAAIHELGLAIRRACDAAGADVSSIGPAVLCLAGADWPEDYRFLECESRRMGLSGCVDVYNDAFGPLRSGSAQFVGVSIVCGTGAATGARSSAGALWHTSWWQEPHGARHLGQKALRAVYRADLGVGPETSMTARVLEAYQVGSVEELLHRATARGHVPFSPEAAAHVLTAEAAAGDAVAVGVVRTHGNELGTYGVAATRRVGLSGGVYPLVLAGSVLMSSAILRKAVVESFLAVEAEAKPVVPALSPAAGALLLAFDTEGLSPDLSSWEC